ncbi:MAG: hypothetical protein WBM35_13945 [Candidatus Electrothrix sp.]
MGVIVHLFNALPPVFQLSFSEARYFKKAHHRFLNDDIAGLLRGGLRMNRGEKETEEEQDDDREEL